MWFRRLQCFLALLVYVLLFIRQQELTLYIIVYANDMVITRDNDGEIRNVLDKLEVEFSIKKLGYLEYFLGIHV